jgi:hypothetical protein
MLITIPIINRLKLNFTNYGALILRKTILSILIMLFVAAAFVITSPAKPAQATSFYFQTVIQGDSAIFMPGDSFTVVALLGTDASTDQAVTLRMKTYSLYAKSVDNWDVKRLNGSCSAYTLERDCPILTKQANDGNGGLWMTFTLKTCAEGFPTGVDSVPVSISYSSTTYNKNIPVVPC